MVLEVKNLKTYFYTDKGVGKAVDDISFTLKKGEILSIVGESGSGKSMTAYSILKLIGYPGKIISGKIIFNGKDLIKLTDKEMRKIRGNDISMIFQDPMNSLNPVFTVGTQLVETIVTHKNISKKEATKLSLELLEKVILPKPDKVFDSYPHQLSGGMRQRVMIALALSCSPKVLIADEPTTALDVSIQKEILKLLLKLRDEEELSIIFITHDFRVVKEIADSVAVMYAGKILEKRKKENILKNPLHPYTKALLQSLPKLDEKTDSLPVIPGNVPDIFSFDNNCRFYNRCNIANEKCLKGYPEKVPVNENEYFFCVNI